MYPNMLTFFLRQYNDLVLLRCRTEDCPVKDLHLCQLNDVAALDRNMVVLLCSAMQEARTEETGAQTSASGSGGSKELQHDKPRFELFTTLVSRFFKAAGRNLVLEKKALEDHLAETFSVEEIASGMSGLESLNKIMLADDTVILVS